MEEAIKSYLMANYFTAKETYLGVINITPSNEQEDSVCGNYDSDGSLCVLFPNVFSGEAVKAVHPNASIAYGRSMMCYEYVKNEVYSYVREKHEFFEREAFDNAIRKGFKMLLMENLS